MRKALVVGINDYPKSPLRSGVGDARSIEAVLKTHGDGSPNFAVRTLTCPPDDIKRSTLREAIQQLFLEGDPEISLFFFSGHGHFTPSGGMIVTADYEAYDEGISMHEILTTANKSKAKNKIVILDCCFSGAFGASTIDPAQSFLSEGLSILTACRATEKAIEVNGCGVFTTLVVSALQGGAADLRGEITPGSVYAYVDQALGPWDHRPIFKTNVTQFSSLRTVAPPVPKETLRNIVKYFETPEAQYGLDPSYEFTSTNPNSDHVKILKELQKLNRVNLVVPEGEDDMYFAAMNSKTCRLTALGAHYWRLVNDGLV